MNGYRTKKYILNQILLRKLVTMGEASQLKFTLDLKVLQSEQCNFGEGLFSFVVKFELETRWGRTVSFANEIEPSGVAINLFFEFGEGIVIREFVWISNRFILYLFFSIQQKIDDKVMG